MLSVHLICVGRLKEKFYQAACAEYVKRLSPYCRLTVTENMTEDDVISYISERK